MAKTSKKRQPAAKRAPKRQGPRSTLKAKTHANSHSRASTKQARAIAMLRSAGGASIDALMEATDWQQHSVRGFLAGVVKKRLGLPLLSVKIDGSRVYRIADDVKRHPATDQPTF